MLSEIISRTTGMCLKDWLQSRVFKPLGITDVSWDTNGPVNTGAWGLLIAPRDLCKLGILYLNKGVYNNPTHPHGRVDRASQYPSHLHKRPGLRWLGATVRVSNLGEHSRQLPRRRSIWTILHGVPGAGHGNYHHSRGSGWHANLSLSGAISAKKPFRSSKGQGCLGLRAPAKGAVSMGNSLRV